MHTSSDTKLEELLLLWEEQCDLGGEPSLESICADSPELMDELRLRVQALQKMDALLDTKAPATDTAGDTAGAMESPQGSLTAAHEYELHRQVARGGRATIHAARDGLLDREVAVKKLHPSCVHDPFAQQRLAREAKIISGLDHPGIVPVYTMGYDEHRRPFYSMRLVSGGTLRQAIGSFHSHDVTKGDQNRSALLTLLRHYVDACQTVAYAHGQGVVHRDIKPENILVGDFGATFVVDWGLAKWLDETDPRLPKEDDSWESQLLAETPELTQTGASLGTPAYMSPEQANGDNTASPIAADIFNLGATLYTILTGRAPYDGTRLVDVIRRAQQASFTAPRKSSHRTEVYCDPALEAVCLKAMAKRAEDRYQSAKALAMDVERVIADEPVDCYDDPWSRQAIRWARQHRTMLSALSLILVGTILAMGIGGLMVNAQRRRADANFKSAHQAVTDAFVRISNDALLKQAEFQELRSQLLSSSLGFYEQLMTENERDPRVRFEMADASMRVGVLRNEMGRHRESIEMLEEANRLFAGLRRESPDNPLLAHRHGHCLRMLGAARHQTPAAAFEAFSAGRDVLQAALNGSKSHEPAAVRELVSELAETLLAHSDLANANGESETANELLVDTEQLLTRYRRDDFVLGEALLGRCQLIRSERLAREEKHEAALTAAEDALLPIRRAMEVQPSDPIHSRSAGIIFGRIGQLLTALDRPAEAAEKFEESASTFEQLVMQRPHVLDFRRRYAEACEHLSDALHTLDQHAAALEWVRKAVGTKLAVGIRDEALQRKLGQRFYDLGLWHRGEDRIGDAHQNFVAAKRALDVIGHHDPDLSYSLAGSLRFIGVDQWNVGKGARALDSFQQATAILEDLAESRPENPNYPERLAASIMGEAMALEMLGRYEEQIERCQVAIDAQRALEGSHEAFEWDPAVGLSLSYFLLSGGYQLTGQAEAAKDALESSRALMPAEPDTLFQFARNYAQQAARFGRDKSSYSDVEHRQFRRYVTESLHCLTRAVELGDLDIEQITNDPAFLALRAEPQFVRLVGE